MQSNPKRAEIIVNGLVQGVGFRYFVLHNAERLGVLGYTKNLYTGEVLTVVEGDKSLIEELFKVIKVGPMHAQVKNASIKWSDPKNEFNEFGVRY
ncbi:MAG: acylphosphatase [Melioribacteraceae bacterium]|nr:acylphosphatase [Melioribacteraceae bacterium]MCF8356381.1 acylphosphatase [Melioribacteraceae bacterium]MCF8395764.1 acylphosphatase [Melioribacteraceae bacterium]MCF8420893.1 acylphosphatase [Melioribacteraceae bacterium]